MNVFAIIVLFLIVFATGVLGGMLIGYDTAATISKEKRVCDMCDNHIGEKEALFCNDCYEEESEDKLERAVKQKERGINYKNSTLRQRTLIEKPSKEELAQLEDERKETGVICEFVEKVSSKLNLGVNVEPLRKAARNLGESVQKWQTINDREEAVDKILQDDFFET